MKPASTIQFTSASRSAPTNARSNASRSAKSLCGMVKALTPAARARSKACAPGRLEITTLTRAFKRARADGVQDRLQIGAHAGDQYAEIEWAWGGHRAAVHSTARAAALRARSSVARKPPLWPKRLDGQRWALPEHRRAHDLRADRREQDAVPIVPRAQEQARDLRATEQRQVDPWCRGESSTKCRAARRVPARARAPSRATSRSRTAPAVTSRS